MQFGVLITNHGKHSDEKLAIAVATDIVQIGADASGQQAIDGRKLENRIIGIMEGYFTRVAQAEHDGIAANGTAHLSSDPAAVYDALLDDAVANIMAAIAESPFASWFTADHAEAYVRKSVGKWLSNSSHMHRDWFARHGKVGNGTDLKVSDRHDSDCEHVKRWIAAA